MPANSDSEFVARLRQTFRLEAEEHLRAISDAITGLASGAAVPAARGELVERAFREAHSLKGAANAVHLPAIERVCQAIESAFSKLKGSQGPLSEELLKALDAATAALSNFLPAALLGDATPAEFEAVIGPLVGTLASEDSALPPPRAAAAAPFSSLPSAARPPEEKVLPVLETVRVRVGLLNALMQEAEELRVPKLLAAQRAAELRQLGAPLQGWKATRSRLAAELRELRRVSEGGAGGAAGGAARPGALARVLEFVERTDAAMAEIEARSHSLAQAAEADYRVLAGLVDGLQERMKHVLMSPVSSLLEGLPRQVRDLARSHGKRVELQLEGTEIEADRRILQELRTPLIHLVRNMVDHGIEAPEERLSAGKPAVGNIRIAAKTLENRHFEIVVGDDGRGVDGARARAAALQAGVISREQSERMTEAELVELIFESGVTTSPALTDLSGRGLGLAIVREKVEQLGGRVAVSSRVGAGTSFRIELPLTLAAFRGVLLRVNDALFLAPVFALERVLRVPATEVRTLENRETVLVEGQAVALVRLSALVRGKPTKAAPAEGWIHVVILAAAGKRAAFAVDEIVAEQEVVQRTLGPPLAALSGLAGATVLGNGAVVPILDVAELMQSAIEMAPRREAASLEERAAEQTERSVLVVEDSITARSLLKNILESAGYRVRTAVDGAEAFALLKEERFDLVVSDVEMPRMNGIELTAAIRADRALAELPVVLVTGLESQADRERGIDAGANAYIVKSSFEHGKLLEAVARLL